ncbi:class I SAM-dependent methyltransferase [Rhodococcus opacus]|nr:class I SAM-dependent methyltransferase [Rhodococcus opacus]
MVTSTLVIHYITPGNRATALAEMARVLRPGGRLLVANHLISALAGHAMAHTPIGELTGLIEQAGLRVTGTGDHRPWLHYLRADKPSP